MNAFRKKKKPDTGLVNSMQDHIATRIAATIQVVQSKFAIVLNKKLSSFSVRQLRLGLIVFAFGWSVLSICVIVEAVFGQKDLPMLSIKPVTFPQHALITDESVTDTGTFENTQQTLRLFENYVDSLRRYDRRYYDSLLLVRPGLFDSVRYLKEFITNAEK